MKLTTIPLLFATLLALAPTGRADSKDDAYSALQGGRREEAVTHFRTHLRDNPADAGAAAEAAGLLAGLGRHDEAVSVLSNAHAANPDDERILFRLASEKVFGRKYAEARSHFSALARSSDEGMASRAATSLEALDKAEARERSARATRPAKIDLMAQAEYRKKKELLDRQQFVYDLAAKHQDAEVVAAVEGLEKSGGATDALLTEKAYALDRLGKSAAACKIIRGICERNPHAAAERLFLAGLLKKTGRASEAFAILRDVRDGHSPDERHRRIAAAEIDSLPDALNPERVLWGEFDLFGTTLSRYGLGVASGRIREGFFVPGARWIEPFLQADFTLDTKSGQAGEGITTIYNENLAGFHAGVRIRPFATQSFVLYAMMGIQKNMLSTGRYPNQWFAEFIVGANGYWAWGPGVSREPAAMAAIANGGSPPLEELPTGRWTPNNFFPVRPCFDWFVEAGGDAAYYSRLQDFIAYLQSRQGVRILRCGRAVALDAYIVENLTIDSKGNYSDNYFEAGPGLRVLVSPTKSATLSLNAEYLGGAYLGRNANDSRGSTPATYSDFRISVSLSLRW